MFKYCKNSRNKNTNFKKRAYEKETTIYHAGLSVLWTSATLAQVSKVTGVVISEEGNEPVVGASILVKGFSQGVITNVNGEFTLTNVPNDARTLIISFVGMKTQEVAIKPQLRIIMSNDSQMLDEVIVTVAYGTAKNHR